MSLRVLSLYYVFQYFVLELLLPFPHLGQAPVVPAKELPAFSGVWQ
jgi:hypothetical protein